MCVLQMKKMKFNSTCLSSLLEAFNWPTRMADISVFHYHTFCRLNVKNNSFSYRRKETSSKLKNARKSAVKCYCFLRILELSNSNAMPHTGAFTLPISVTDLLAKDMKLIKQSISFCTLKLINLNCKCTNFPLILSSILLKKYFFFISK